MLFHDDLPGNDVPLYFLHGWCCDRHTLRDFAGRFPGHARRLIDLLGHGDSPAWRHWTIEEQAQAALRAAPPHAVWIGHSMGAQVALEAEKQAPGTIAAIILLEPGPISPSDRAKSLVSAFQSQLECADDPAALVRAFAAAQILHHAPAASVQALVETMAAAPPDLIRSGWRALATWDGTAALAAATCPLLMINGEGALNRSNDMLAIQRNLMAGQVIGSGHMVQLEAPAQAVAMINRFLAIKGLLSHSSG